MLLVSFFHDGQINIGVLDPQRNEVVALTKLNAALPNDMTEFIANGPEALAIADSIVQSGKGRIPVPHVRLLAPIPHPRRNIFCIGKNYRAHIQELQGAGAGLASTDTNIIPEKPIFFTKATTTVIGPGEVIPAGLDPTSSVDYEGELAVIIGKGGRGISQADAIQHIFGYSIINDVTSRRLQRDHQQWFLGKSLDGFCPMGPTIVTAAAIADIKQLHIRTWVNGELRQNDSIANLIFDIPAIIETLSRTMTLLPGDIIATGTPAGVGVGFKPPRYLQKGDIVRIEVDSIGTLENPVG